jgi:hypothetical protein
MTDLPTLWNAVADIFISYKRNERQAIERLASELRRLGFSVWFDAGLNAGEAFSDEIDREAKAAKAIVVCWSPSALQSQWVKAEALIGFEQGKLAACYVAGPDGFSAPAPFNAIHAEDLRTWVATQSESHSGWRGMLRRVGRLCARADVESYGAMDAYASAATLRGWLQQHDDSPLFLVVEQALRARQAEEAEIARLEEAARRRHAEEEAEWRADQATTPLTPNNDPASIYDAKRQELHTQKEIAEGAELEEFRWAFEAAQSVAKLIRDLRAVLPRWHIEFDPLNMDSKYDYAMLIAAAPPDATDEQLLHALRTQEWERDFIEAGVFIEQSRILIECGDFGAQAFFRKDSPYIVRSIAMQWRREVQCVLSRETAAEIANFNPVLFETFVGTAEGANTYSGRLRSLHAWISERFAEFCAIREISPEHYVQVAEANRLREARTIPPTPKTTRAAGLLNYVKDTVLALVYIFLLVLAFGWVAQVLNRR